jgi:hypothetical protein
MTLDTTIYPDFEGLGSRASILAWNCRMRGYKAFGHAERPSPFFCFQKGLAGTAFCSFFIVHHACAASYG